MAFQCRVRSDINTCAADVSSKTVWSPQILGRYLLGGTSSGPQIKAARKPSNCSKFIERSSPKRSRTALRSSSSVWVSGCDFMGQPSAELSFAANNLFVVGADNFLNFPRHIAKAGFI